MISQRTPGKITADLVQAVQALGDPALGAVTARRHCRVLDLVAELVQAERRAARDEIVKRRETTQQRNDRVLAAVQRLKRASRRQVMAELHPASNVDAVKHSLQQLVKQGRIRTDGARAGTRYVSIDGEKVTRAAEREVVEILEQHGASMTANQIKSSMRSRHLVVWVGEALLNLTGCGRVKELDGARESRYRIVPVSHVSRMGA